MAEMAFSGEGSGLKRAPEEGQFGVLSEPLVILHALNSSR